jgi:hypothetical protein
MSLAVMEDKAANPGSVRLLSAQAIVMHPQNVSHPIEKFLLAGRFENLQRRHFCHANRNSARGTSPERLQI